MSPLAFVMVLAHPILPVIACEEPGPLRVFLAETDLARAEQREPSEFVSMILADQCQFLTKGESVEVEADPADIVPQGRKIIPIVRLKPKKRYLTLAGLLAQQVPPRKGSQPGRGARTRENGRSSR